MRETKRFILLIAIGYAILWKYKTIFLFITYTLGVLEPLLLGGGIALFLNPPMRFLEGKIDQIWFKKESRMPRRISLAILLIIVSSAILFLVFQIFPQVQKQFFQIEWNQLIKYGKKFIKMEGLEVVDSTMSFARLMIRKVATVFVAIAFSCYLLLQKEKLRDQAMKVLYAFFPQGRADAIQEVLGLTRKTFESFLTGQCVEALILGTMFGVSLWVFGFPYSLLIGCVIGVTALVPIFGAFVGCVVGVFLIYMADPAKVIGFVILFLVLQQIEGNFIYPHVVGNSIGLSPIWVLAAVSIGGSLMGITGMLIFIPLAAVSYALFREVVYILLRKRE